MERREAYAQRRGNFVNLLEENDDDAELLPLSHHLTHLMWAPKRKAAILQSSAVPP